MSELSQLGNWRNRSTTPGQLNWVGRRPLVNQIGQKLNVVAPATNAAMLGIALGFLFWSRDDSRVSRLSFVHFLGLRTLFSSILISFYFCLVHSILFGFLFSCFKLGNYYNSA